MVSNPNNKALKARVIRPVPGGVMGAGTGAAVVPVVGVNTFAAQLPVKSGDLIGYDNAGGDPDPPTVTAQVAAISPPGAQFTRFDSPIADGETRISGGLVSNNSQLLFNADIEPDCDSDGFGDETQDGDISSCSPAPPSKADRALTLDANKNRVKKGKRVLLSGRLDSAEQACESGQTVELQRKKPTHTAFTTLEQLGTDAAGNFSTKEKVKKTFQYRAQALETAVCNPQVSNTKKVKVTKKK